MSGTKTMCGFCRRENVCLGGCVGVCLWKEVGVGFFWGGKLLNGVESRIMGNRDGFLACRGHLSDDCMVTQKFSKFASGFCAIGDKYNNKSVFICYYPSDFVGGWIL